MRRSDVVLDEAYFDRIFSEFRQVLASLGKVLPAVSLVAVQKQDPFSVLISTVISLRTKDDVTLNASRRLLAEAPDPRAMLQLSEDRIADLIFPAGFYRRKAMQIRQISEILVSEYDGKVPSDAGLLMQLPGVGIKTANLTLNLGFGIDAICVDCHVHQISNRLGWIETKTPEESEKALQPVMPRRFWIPLNELLVSYGQEVCTSVSPKCSMCPENRSCPKVGVTRSR
ncbi:MAG: endonuclease III [Spirochaetales bacterium]|nr:endonuclease III [Spirochaetales bacterium]MBQ4281082.1 endonuclease III [Spirochaetales bacterium]MBQ4501297.1 endonuclease III [Spirochaetales bacterium]MBQ6124790.1 endonuclease III [Spirochaetales bacterium]MBR6234267.1 endonuclease III [Spirochaetales bacterium]